MRLQSRVRIHFQAAPICADGSGFFVAAIGFIAAIGAPLCRTRTRGRTRTRERTLPGGRMSDIRTRLQAHPEF